MKKYLFLTGPSGVGKTTIIKEALGAQIAYAGGFLTERVTDESGKAKHMFVNHNRLLRSYEGAIGVKTGYTSKAGRCLISTAKQGDFYYLSIVTGCQTIQTESGAVVYDSFVQTKKLLEHGLNDFRFATVISQLVPVAQVPVTEAAVSSVVVAPASDVTALLPADYDESKLTTTYTLDSGESLQAPLTTDQDVGTITVYYDGAAIASTTVRPITAVEQHIIQYAARNVGHNLRKYIGLVILLVCVLLILLIVIRNNRIRRRKAAARRKKAEARRERKD